LNDGTIEFQHRDLTQQPLESWPVGDVWIMKDVLQHWSTAEFVAFLDKLTTSDHYKYILMTNTATTGPNKDILTGRFRAFNLREEPLKKYGFDVVYQFDNKDVGVLMHP